MDQFQSNPTWSRGPLVAKPVLKFLMVRNGTQLQTNGLIEILMPEINYLRQKIDILRVSEQSKMIRAPSIKQACTVLYPIGPIRKIWLFEGRDQIFR